MFVGHSQWREDFEVLKSLGTSYRALVLGASGALGHVFVEALQTDAACAEVVGLSRSSQPAFRLEDEASIAAAAASLQGPFHLIIDATGALTIDGQGPEKHMGALNAAQLARAFEVNTIALRCCLNTLCRCWTPITAAFTLSCQRVWAASATTAKAVGMATVQPKQH